MVVQQVTYDEVERMKDKISLRNSNGSAVLMSDKKLAIKCPLSLVCYPSCSWWQDGKCNYSEEGKSRIQEIERNKKRQAALQAWWTELCVS